MVISQDYYIFIDIFIGLIYLAMFFIGYKRGLLYELINVIYTVASLFAAWFASPVFASLFPLIDLTKIIEDQQLLIEAFDLNGFVNEVAYFIIIFLLLKLFYVLISVLVRSFNKIPVIGRVNQFFGGIFGLINATLITLFLSMLLMLPLFKNGKDIIDHTLLRYIRSYSNDALGLITETMLQNKVGDRLDNIDIESYREQLSAWLQSLNENE